MAQLKVLFFINSLTWTYLIFLATYLVVGKIMLPREIKTQLIRNILSN